MQGPPEPDWEAEIVAVLDHHKHRCVRAVCRSNTEKTIGYAAGALRTRLRRHGLETLQTECFVPRTTDSTNGPRCTLNLLLNQPPPTQNNQLWMSGITHPTLASKTWEYFCAF